MNDHAKESSDAKLQLRPFFVCDKLILQHLLDDVDEFFCSAM